MTDVERAPVNPREGSLHDAVAWAILHALHEDVPEDQRPMSWSDMDEGHEKRIHAAADAAITAVFGQHNIRPGESAETEVGKLRTVLKPFDDMARELFARNWNASDVVLALDNPDDPHRLTCDDFFAIRAAIFRLEQGNENREPAAHPFPAKAKGDRNE